MERVDQVQARARSWKKEPLLVWVTGECWGGQVYQGPGGSYYAFLLNARTAHSISQRSLT